MKTQLQMHDGETYVTVTRVYFGWDVADRRGRTFVSALDFPALQSKGLDEFVDGRSVAGAIVDRAKCATA
jgi:hypothetical protein